MTGSINSYKPQIALSLIGVALTVGAVALALFPGVMAITGLALPIILGVGALLSWGAAAYFHSKRRIKAPPEESLSIPNVEEKPQFERAKNFLLDYRYKAECSEEAKKEWDEILRGIEDVNEPLQHGSYTLLTFIALLGSPTYFLEKVLERGGNLNYQEPGFQNTPLLWAIANGNNTIASEMIQRGGSNHDLNLQDRSFGNSALTLAIAKGYVDKTGEEPYRPLTISNLQLVQALIEKGAEVNRANKGGYSPMRLAVLRRNLKMVQALHEAGARIPQEWQEDLGRSYEEVFEILKQQACVFTLDRSSFESSHEAVRAYITSKTRAE